MPAAHAGSTAASHGVDFVNKDDTRRVLFGLGKQVTHTRGADTDKHLYEFRAGDAKERHVGFAGHGPGKHSLTGTGRADQQDSLRYPGPHASELLRILQKLNDFLEV